MREYLKYPVICLSDEVFKPMDEVNGRELREAADYLLSFAWSLPIKYEAIRERAEDQRHDLMCAMRDFKRAGGKDDDLVAAVLGWPPVPEHQRRRSPILFGTK
jgi:hypothetical protein